MLAQDLMVEEERYENGDTVHERTNELLAYIGDQLRRIAECAEKHDRGLRGNEEWELHEDAIPIPKGIFK